MDDFRDHGPPPPGESLRRERTRRGLTQRDVADAVADLAWQQLGIRVGVDAGMISKWERGTKRPSRAYRRLLCQIFGVTERELGFPSIAFDVEASMVQRAEADRRSPHEGAAPPGISLETGFPVAMASGPATSTPAHRMRAALARANVDLATSGEVDLQPVNVLRDGVRRAWNDFQSSGYSDLAQRAPDLLSGLRFAARHLDGDGRLEANSLLAETCQVITYALTKLGDPQAAWLASEHGLSAARACGDDLMIGHSAAVMSYALRESGHPIEAESLCLETAESLEPTVGRPDPGRLSVYGLLLLKGSVAAAQAGSRDRAAFLLRLAEQTAKRLGIDANHRHTAFGPTSVALYQVAVAVDLGDGGLAVELARKIPPSQVVAKERLAHLLIDVARGYGQWGKLRDALGTLLSAERLAPEEVRGQPNVKKLVIDLAHRSAVRLPELKPLASRVGLEL